MPNTSLYHRVLRTGDPTKSWLSTFWGARPGHRDELILRDRDTTGDGGLLDERLYCLMDYFKPGGGGGFGGGSPGALRLVLPSG